MNASSSSGAQLVAKSTVVTAAAAPAAVAVAVAAAGGKKLFAAGSFYELLKSALLNYKNGLGFVAYGLLAILYTSWKKHMAYKYSNRKRIKNNWDVGRFIGMDLGGTLAKIVYFQTDQNEGGGGESNRNSRLNSNSSNSDIGSTGEISKSRLSSAESVEGSPGGEGESSPEVPYSPYVGLKSHNSRSSSNLLKEEEISALKDWHALFANNRKSDKDLTMHSKALNGTIHFYSDETKNVSTAIKNLKDMDKIIANIRTIGCTGGGAIKYADELKAELDVEIIKVDEFESLIKGMNAVLTELYEEDECYTYVPTASKEEIESDTKQFTSKSSMKFDIDQNDVYPYLVVNIGSGVSILKVNGRGKNDYERVSGSSVGGGTFWGLCKLICPEFSDTSYEDVIKRLISGNTQVVDLSVKDIYGTHVYNNKTKAIALNESTTASSFGQFQRKKVPREGVEDIDLAKGLLMMITNNIGQLAYLNAKLHKCKNIFFIGNFLRNNEISCHKLAYSLDFWSNHEMKALFLRHEGYFGALGTFLINAEEVLKDSKKISSAVGNIAGESTPVDDVAISYSANDSSFVKFGINWVGKRIRKGFGLRENFVRRFRTPFGSKASDRASTDVNAAQLVASVSPNSTNISNINSNDMTGSKGDLPSSKKAVVAALGVGGLPSNQYDSEDEISLNRPSNVTRRKDLGLGSGDSSDDISKLSPRQRNNTYDEDQLKKVKESVSLVHNAVPNPTPTNISPPNTNAIRKVVAVDSNSSSSK